MRNKNFVYASKYVLQIVNFIDDNDNKVIKIDSDNDDKDEDDVLITMNLEIITKFQL